MRKLRNRPPVYKRQMSLLRLRAVRMKKRRFALSCLPNLLLNLPHPCHQDPHLL
jgi:hypothetical protein